MNEEKQVLPIVIHDDLLSKIYNYYKDKKINDTGLSYAVYIFLYKTARIQNNIRVYASDSFIREGVGIGTDKLKEIKRDLRELKLIETIRPRDKNGHFTKEVFIEVKFIWKNETLDKLMYQEATEQTLYKLAKELLLTNFDEYEEIKSNTEYEFNIVVNGREEIITADSFYFDEGLLKCTAEFSYENTYEYTVPTEQVAEIVQELANGYKFNFNAISKVMLMNGST